MDRPDDMPALDPAATALLARYRRDRPAMPARARDRVEVLLRDPDASRRRARRVPWIVGLAIAAACLLWASGRHLPRSQADAANPSAAPFWSTSQARMRAAPLPAPPTRAATTPEVADPPAPPSPPRKRVDRREPSATAKPQDLPREQEMLARGWRALADGDARTADAIARAHANTFPAGALTPERQALAAISACALDPAHGAALAREFLAAQPRSPLARRVREGCEVAQ